jgi:hypothetical protein
MKRQCETCFNLRLDLRFFMKNFEGDVLTKIGQNYLLFFAG